ncbi:MAG: AbrB/MazE/SpoVT family DNA-binding domain-containing protein [Rhizomicrobium sp.]
MSAVTSKGQVTIPKRIRDALGLSPGTKVEFGMEEPGRAFVRPAGKPKKDDFEKRLAKARKGFDLGGLTTDAYMKLLRGDDE